MNAPNASGPGGMTRLRDMQNVDPIPVDQQGGYQHVGHEDQ